MCKDQLPEYNQQSFDSNDDLVERIEIPNRQIEETWRFDSEDNPSDMIEPLDEWDRD